MKKLNVGLVMTLTAVAGAMPAQAQARSENPERPDPQLAQPKLAPAVTRAQVAAIAHQTQPTPETTPSLEFLSTPQPNAAALTTTPLLTANSLLPTQVRQRLGTPNPAATPTVAPPPAQSTPSAVSPAVQVEPIQVVPVSDAPIAPPPMTAAPTGASEITISAPMVATPQPAATPQISPAAPIAMPAVAQTPGLDPAAAEKLRQLEERQQALEAELKTLRQQIANPTTIAQPAAITIPEMDPQALTVSAEALFFRPTTSNSLDFAIIDPGTALATSGDLATANYSDGTALRVGVNYRLPHSPWDVDGTYTFFNTDGSAQVERPATGFLFSTLSHPRQNESADTASAQSTLDLKNFTIDAGYRFQLSQGLGVRLFAGLQVADTEQSLAVNYDGRDYNGGRIDLASKFSGWGPRLGAEMRASLGGGFSVFGRGSAAILFGQSSARFTETDNNGTDVIADLARDRTRTVPVINLALGLDWAAALSTNSKFNLSLGYEFQQWFNVSDNIRFVNAASPAVFAENAGSLSLQGFFVRGGFSFNF